MGLILISTGLVWAIIGCVNFAFVITEVPTYIQEWERLPLHGHDVVMAVTQFLLVLHMLIYWAPGLIIAGIGRIVHHLKKKEDRKKKKEIVDVKDSWLDQI